MIQTRRLAFAVLSTPDIDRQISYYTDILGLALVSRDTASAVLATRHGVETIVLKLGSEAGLLGLSFQVSPTTDLDAAQLKLEEAGISAKVRPGQTPSIARVLAFNDPKGTEIELFSTFDFVEAPPGDNGINPLKLGHVAYFVTDMQANIRFYEQVLGFRRSDWRGDGSMFLRCGVDHHTINFFRRDKDELGHIAFEVKDWSELSRASDYLARCKFFLDWGPARHHIGHNVACYHSNPDNVRVELYTEMDQMKDEELGYFDPRPWHEDRPQRPKNWPADTKRNQWIPNAP
jgi:catechol 2,3-dioxygenase-like lactoylglutathione lyase family enzyme